MQFLKQFMLVSCLLAEPVLAEENQEVHKQDPKIQESIEQAQALSNAFSYVSGQVMPSVVNISAIKNLKQRPQFYFRGRRGNSLEDFFGQDLFEQLFPDEQYNFNGTPNLKRQSGMGTGFIIDEEGHILTNNHVIEDADELEVKLYDDTVLKAEIVGADDKTDLAVLKIKTDKKLIPVKFGSSEKLKIGEWVVAVGNPFGLDHTITTGVVSAKGRSISPSSMKYEDYIQTDAAINPGNSGGPLVNLYGEVVGINSAIFSKNGGYMGIGFAIPIDLAKSVLESLTQNGKVVRGWLGVAIQDLSEDLAASFNYKGTSGALIGDVTPNGPAEKAGLKIEDIIVKFNNQIVKDVNHLRFMVAASAPNSEVPIEIYRNGKLEELKVQLSEMQNEIIKPQFKVKQDIELGMSLKDLDPVMRRQMDFNTDGNVVVMEVAPYSIAANAGIRPMDVILKVGGVAVNSQKEFQSEVKKYNLASGIRLVVETSGMKRFVILRK